MDELRVDASYRNTGNWKKPHDEFNRFFRFADGKGINNTAGFRPKSRAGGNTDVTACAFCVLVTNFGEHEWPDLLDGGAPIAARLNQDVEDVAVRVHRAPHVLLATIEDDEHLIEIPRVAETSAPPPEPSCIRGPERPRPPSDRLIGDRDTPLGQEVLNISQTETEAKVEPDRVSDDLGWKSITVIARGGTDHATTLLRAASM